MCRFVKVKLVIKIGVLSLLSLHRFVSIFEISKMVKRLGIARAIYIG